MDSENTKEILQLLDEIAADGKLVITVTHSQTVADYGTRIVRLADGQISEDTTLKPAYPAASDNELTTHTLRFGATLKMALDNMRYNFKRNLLIIIGAAIGIFSVILMQGGLGNGGVQGYINHEIYSQINPNAVQVAKNISADELADGSNKVNLTDKDQQRFESIKNVKDVQKGGYYVQGGTRLQRGKKTANLQIMQTYNDTIKKNSIKKGSAPKTGEILLTKENAQKFNKQDPNAMIGKKIVYTQTVMNSKKQPVQLKKMLKVSGIAAANSGATSITYDTLNQMYDAKNVKLAPNFMTVVIKGNAKNVKPVQTQIKSYKTGKKATYTITGAGAIVDTLNTYIDLAVNVLAAIAGISLLVSAIMIIVVLYISVSERTKEIGILRALGASKGGSIRNLFFSEAFFIGLFSAILAVVLALLIQVGANSLSQSGIHYAIMQISGGNIAFGGVIISIVISLLAALAPAGRAARLDPIESLSYE